jgi:hypothetical protein
MALLFGRIERVAATATGLPIGARKAKVRTFADADNVAD